MKTIMVKFNILMLALGLFAGCNNGFSIEITPLNPRINKDNTLQFTAQARYKNSVIDITNSAEWESSNTDTAVIDKLGMARSLNEGNTTITAKYDNQSSHMELLVTAPGCIGDLSNWKTKYQPNQKDCRKCHTTCTSLGHGCIEGKPWSSTMNCLGCHSSVHKN